MILACDFETETDTIANFQKRKQPVSINLKKTYKKNDVVVNPLVHICYMGSENKDSEKNFIIKHTFIEFLLHIHKMKLPSTKREPIKLLYHNLTYDFAIMKEELLYSDFIQVVEEDESKKYKNLPNKHRLKGFTKSNYFTIVGQDLRQMRFGRIHYRGMYIELVDTFQIYTGSLLNFSKSFAGDEVKGDYDWKKHINGTNYNEILLYGKRDCRVLYKAYFGIIERLGREGKTMSGITMSNFIHDYMGGKENFKQYFPILTSDARKLSHDGYHGGIVYVNEKYKGIVTNDIVAIDVNSMYPYVMQDFNFPYGYPKLIYEPEKINKFNYYEMIIYIDYNMINMFGFFRVYSSNYYNLLYGIANENYKSTDTPTKFKGYVAINSIDLNLLKKYATINELTYMKIFEFKTKNFFNQFMIDKMKMKIEMKEQGDFGGVYTAKVQGNGLYGKFGQNLTGKNKIYTKEINDFQSGKRKMSENYINYYQTDLEGIYTPVASAVTSYSRQILLYGAEQIGFKNVVYGDTDSLYFKDPTGKIIKDFEPNLHYTELGKWDVDTDDTGVILKYKIKVLGLKTYYLETQQPYFFKEHVRQYFELCHQKSVKCVGLNSRIAKQFTLETFKNGEKMITQKSRLGKGGVHIEEKEYVLRRW